MKKILLTAVLFFTTFLFSGLILESHAQTTSAGSDNQVSKAADFSDDELLQIGMEIWHNQCSVWNHPHKVTKVMKDGLTNWQIGTNFASIGMGQFIWYPSDVPSDERMQEDWPGVAQALKTKGYPIKNWELGQCPWKNSADFMADFDGRRLTSLRKLLAKKAVVTEQARCIAERCDAALPKILTSVDADQNLTDDQKTTLKNVLTSRFYQVATDPDHVGLYALMDYVYFRGEGVLSTERVYGDIGWGLRQALMLMSDDVIAQQGPVAAFVAAINKLYFDDDGYDYAARYNTYLTFHFEGTGEKIN